MELSKHRNHRNNKYLAWLRKQKCLASGASAQCAHHIRLGTNGGKGIKPSDYFCIPLLNEYHTTGHSALHIIGEKTFLEKFDLKIEDVFVNFLYRFLNETYKFNKSMIALSPLDAIELLIEEIESRKVSNEKKSRVKKSKPKTNLDDTSQKARFSDSDYYQRAKEIKRAKDKELRLKIKETKQTSTDNCSNIEYQLKMKEQNKEKQKAFRDEHKAKQSEIRKEQYRKAKAFKKGLK